MALPLWVYLSATITICYITNCPQTGFNACELTRVALLQAKDQVLDLKWRNSGDLGSPTDEVKGCKVILGKKLAHKQVEFLAFLPFRFFDNRGEASFRCTRKLTWSTAAGCAYKKRCCRPDKIGILRHVKGGCGENGLDQFFYVGWKTQESDQH